MKLDKPVTGGPCWAEVGAPALEVAKEFYSALFGWRSETDSREEMGGYTIAYVGHLPVAGLVPLGEEPQQPVVWYVTFAVSDVDAVVAKVRSAGGSVVFEPGDVPGMGRFASVSDPQGAAFQLWQAAGFEGAGLLNAPGSLGWVELMTRAPERAVDFYTTVFGWSVDASARYPQWGLDGADFGGMVTMDDKFPPEVPPHWLPYFAVEDVDTASATATEAGGTVLMEPTTVPEGPRIAVLRDPHGAMFGVYRAQDEA
ncbi:VOC family protein [Streptomyces sp. YU58]|uniref:VOC family protein n=1 Tax=Streptomyces sp. SX92 TaxID=3158972 RepID=UPI0027B9A108|nr:VOC family protein [Streptomyces coralus]WLW57138.1 VOC family protein [Streptomyces coralus]